MKKKWTTVEHSKPEEMERRLLEQLDLSPLRQLWRTEEPSSRSEFHTLTGADCFISVSKTESDEGLYVARLHSFHSEESGKRFPTWPRYYFSLYRARQEVEAWMVYHGQLQLPALFSVVRKTAQPQTTQAA
jgi:hypothetical protein